MMSVRPGLPAYARVSYIRELLGDVEGSIEAMRAAAEAGMWGTESRVRVLNDLGELYLRAGRSYAARAVFQGILEEAPEDAAALAGLAQVDFAEGDLVAARARFEQAYRAVPNPAFLDGLLSVAVASGDTAGERDLTDRMLAFFVAAEEMGEVIDVEYADFLVSRGLMLDEALRRAEAAYQRRPGNLQVLETYAWALHVNGRSLNAER